MNNKGFALVELLAVIVILSLLALLTSTAVTKLVKDSKEDLYENQILLIKEAAQTWGADNMYKLPDDGECIYLTLGSLKKYGILDSSIKDPKTNNEFSDDMYIKISSSMSEYGNLITNYEVNAESVEGCEQAYICVLTNDVDKDRQADIGDKVTCGGESFYVMPDHENAGTGTISLLAEMNITLSTEDPVQSSSAGKPAFSSQVYWDATAPSGTFVYDNVDEDELSQIDEYIEAYTSKISSLGISSVKGTLPSYNQLIELGCSEIDKSCSSAPSWVTDAKYWTGSSVGNAIWEVYNKDFYGGGAFPYSSTGMLGLRPVIIIPESAVY